MDLFKFFTRNDKSKDLAKERLKLVLIHDRTNVSPQFIDSLRVDLLEVLHKYVEVDENEVNIQFTRTRRESDSMPVQAIVANIPIKKQK